MRRQVIKIGSSLGVTLPVQEAGWLRLKAGDEVEVTREGNALKIAPLTKIRPIVLGGLWEGVDLSEEEITEARREAWGELFK